MNASELGGREAEQQHSAEHGQLIAIVEVPLVQQAGQDGPNHDEHASDVASRGQEHPERILMSHGSGHGGNHGKHHVHDDVVHTSDGYSGTSKLGLEEAELVHDPTQDRKGRGSDGETHEEVKHQARNSRTPVHVQIVAEADSKHEREDDHGNADGRDAVSGLELLPVKVLPHLEHVGTHAEQAEALDEKQDVGLEDELPLRFADEGAEDHLGQDDTREHLHHHARHPNLLGNLAEEQGDQEDGGSDREEANHRVGKQMSQHGDVLTEDCKKVEG